MNRKLAIAGAALGLALGSFALGRFSVQVRSEERVVYKDRVEYRDRVVEKKVQGPVRVRVETREVPGPQGPERVVIKTVERDPVTTERNSEGQASASRGLETLTLREPVGPSWLIGGSAALRFDKAGPEYGGFLMRRLWGPLWLGASFTSGGAAAQVALSF
jgi:hypothetical protein